MAIKLITGKPGGGKTYYAVNHLLKNYLIFNRKKGNYKLKDGYSIITNIEYLKFPHYKINTVLKSLQVGLEEFFTVDCQTKFSKSFKHIIFVLDECQQFFHRKFYNNDVFYYFQTHRHLGHDIYLITQSAKILPVQITELAELEIRCIPRSLSFFGEFKYNHFISGELVDKSLLKKKKSTFALYKSFQKAEPERLKNPMVKYLLIVGLVLIYLIYKFYTTFFMHGIAAMDKNASAAVLPKTTTITEVVEKK